MTPTTYRLTGFTPSEWDWTNTSLQGDVVTLDIAEPGLYTLRLWAREDGIRLDRILLTTDGNFVPTGNGPAESNFN